MFWDWHIEDSIRYFEFELREVGSIEHNPDEEIREIEAHDCLEVGGGKAAIDLFIVLEVVRVVPVVIAVALNEKPAKSLQGNMVGPLAMAQHKLLYL